MMQKKQHIAIQGIKGSFHHQVALDYFGDAIELVECSSFDVLVEQLLQGNAQQAVMAIENSIAGSIIPNYALLDQNNLAIVGEYHLSIDHDFMALSGQTVMDIQEVHSHPMALLQCKNYFKAYPHIRLVEAEDTAAVAQKIAQENAKGIAAIASSKAAEIYGLKTLGSSIQTIKNNVTRFVIIKKRSIEETNQAINKASMKFVLDHQRGSLATVLNVMSDCLLNLTKIQSLPVIETPGKYAFFVDVTFEEYSNYQKAHSILKIMALEFKILGEYQNAKK